jgi:hypothetical protein
MAATPALKVLKTRCEALRWKSMFIETEGGAELEDSRGSNFWCVYTQKPIGPDGESVAKDTCTASRSCYNSL